MEEPAIVVANREHLWYLLAEAATLEHMIMCQYLYAGFTLKGPGEGLTEEQLAAVDRWRRELHGIAVQEMLHLALVANLMVAIGAAPPFGRPNFPQVSGHFPRGLQLDLLPFGDAALRHFLYLERPTGMELLDADQFVPIDPARRPLDPDEVQPRGQEFATVGHLYRGISVGLRTLADRLGEDGLFVSPARAQATPELFQWPAMIAVTDLKSALAAVEEIIEQGEGASGDWKAAHYGRFHAMWEEFQVMRAADPGFEPARPAVAVFTQQPFDTTEPRPLISDPGTRDVAELFNLSYEVLIQLLLRFFTHTDETEEQKKVLVDASIEVMVQVLAPLGRLLTTLPAGPDHPGMNTGPMFETFYVMTNLVPWRKAAWTLLSERVGILAERCGRVPVAEGVSGAASRIAANLRAHAT